MACGWTPDLVRMLETAGDEKQKRAQQADDELARTTQQLETLKQKAARAAEKASIDRSDWTASYEKWDAWEDDEELAQREQAAREKQAQAQRAAAAAGCNHDHSAEQKLMDMTTREKLDACDGFRTRGNRFFTQGQYQRAAYHYHKALVYFEYVFPDSPDEQDEMDQLQLATLLNFTACRLKTGHLDDAIHHTDLALQLDATNIKALYRRAQAYRLRDEFDKAMADLTTAITTAETAGGAVDPLLLHEKQLLQAKMLAYKLKSKQLSVAMFGGGAATKPTESGGRSYRVSSVRDVPLALATASIVSGQEHTTEWLLDETYRPSTSGMKELREWLETL